MKLVVNQYRASTTLRGQIGILETSSDTTACSNAADNFPLLPKTIPQFEEMQLRDKKQE